MKLIYTKGMQDLLEKSVNEYLVALEADSEDVNALGHEDLIDMMHDARSDGEFMDAAACALALDIWYTAEEVKGNKDVRRIR